MKKFLCLLSIILVNALSVLADDFRFIQVDGVLYNSDNSKKFEKLIEKINKEKDVEFIVFTGNNISRPDKSELKKFLKTANKLNCPYYVVLGQKDVNHKKGLGKKNYMKIVRRNNFAHIKFKNPNYLFAKKGLVFIVADGSKEFMPTPIGYYKDNVIEWLDNQLDKHQNKKVIILQHYPIIPPAAKETHYTYKADKYLKLLSEHKNVKAVIAGHFGVNKETEVNGILHIATQNAPKYRIIDILDYETENPTFWSTIRN